MAFNFIRRLRKKSAPNLLQFNSDVHAVMRARISRAITGQLTAAEASRMVLEKLAAGSRAHFVGTHALLRGDAAAANREVFEIYERVVKANRKRLSKRHWRWP